VGLTGTKTREGAAGIVRDLRHTVRLLRREPGYAAIAVLAIAVGIGATTTLFSVTYGVLLKPLPWPEPDRLVRLEERRGGRTGRVPWTITNGTYLAWRDSSTVDAIGGWMSSSSTFNDAGEPERIRLGRVTTTVFMVLGARARVGRVFDASDTAIRQADTVILSHGFWQRRFGGAGDIVGRSVRVDHPLHRGRSHAGRVHLPRSRNAGVDPVARATGVQRRREAHLAADLRRHRTDAVRRHTRAGRR
jgi:putative ABC transport system permease protein